MANQVVLSAIQLLGAKPKFAAVTTLYPIAVKTMALKLDNAKNAVIQ